MSILDQFLAGATFRTTTPSFEAGEEIEVYVTDFDDAEGDLYALVGETRLSFVDGPRNLVGCRVLARVESFDDDAHRGTVAHLETLDRGSF
ncbi:DUF7513 family protein [Haloarcula nitratireducens]|uniref:DUF7513 domain-containing protein n=1 Tax=Haloarcula nitratireducens TaxID=2487749 RepID=A0AAW4P747_9EURY|nr:hypothetical protein [Halomicroarcula nitratireducens]MBX0293702.1 hypothetical protein [Halomicroarcula nitratireducens]